MVTIIFTLWIDYIHLNCYFSQLVTL